ncbi:MAG: UDP-N-acetylmuramoyl-L-alanine--D-glutamate ligase [Arenicellales bacterium]|nr:UDP-N-acetylmuramoyl-L-alanine--D-glutamate ligase [Arenicellales bacterium]
MAGKRKALVVGLGQTGLSCVQFLVAKGADVTVVDSRDLPPMYRTLHDQLPDIPIHTGAFQDEHFLAADFIVVSPGVALDETVIKNARDYGIEVIGDVELFLREIEAPVLAITGSNGKSTVTALVGDMCRQHGLNVEVAGNIGIPVLDLLREHETWPDCFVLELSSFQLESTDSLRAHAAALLNLSVDHMDRYASFEDYLKVKGRIFVGDGMAIVNRNDPNVIRALPAGKHFVSFGSDIPPTSKDYGLVKMGGVTWLARGNDNLMPASSVPLTGGHNSLNVLAAVAMAEQMGVSVESCIKAVEGFQGLPHRMEVTLEKDKVTWINDSKATNIGATAAALNGLTTPVVLIAGGDAKGADFFPLREPILKRVRTVVLLGRDADRIEKTITGLVPIIRAVDMKDAVSQAKSAVVAGDTVLLSPACASFDMYDNFEQRGEHFKSLVHELV